MTDAAAHKAGPALGESAAKLGRTLEMGANRPLLISGPPRAWVVLEGGVNLFWTPRSGSGRRRHLWRAAPGQVLLAGPPAGPEEPALLALGMPGSRLAELSPAQWWSLAEQADLRPALAAALQAWFQGLWQGLGAGPPPGRCRPLAPGAEMDVPAGEAVISGGGLVWLGPADGCRLAGGENAQAPPGTGLLPLPPGAWLTVPAERGLRAMDSAAFLERAPSWAPLEAFHRLFMSLAGEQAARSAREERRGLERRAALARDLLARSVARMAGVLSPRLARRLAARAGEDPLLGACRLVAGHLGQEVRQPPGDRQDLPADERISLLAQASGLRIRAVALEGLWTRRDHGPLLAFRRQDGGPVALLPQGPGSYLLHDPSTGRTERLGQGAAAGLERRAYSFYRSLGPEPVSAWGLIKFGFKGIARDLGMVLAMGLLGGLAALVTPVAMGFLFDTVIPQAKYGQLWRMAAILGVMAVAAAAFQLARGLAMLRVEGRVDYTLQAALWDRLLDLPAPFFRRFSAGDLAMRAEAISSMRKMLSATAVTSVLSGVFSLLSLALLFYYSWPMALLALGLLGGLVLAAALLGYLSLRYVRPLLNLRGKINGLVFQLIQGVNKLRLAGAEDRAFWAWSRLYSRQRELAWRAMNYENLLASFSAAMPVLAVGVLFYYVAYHAAPGELSMGDFMAFILAFASLLTSLLAMSRQVLGVLAVVPMYERARPLLTTRPEREKADDQPRRLQGNLEASGLAFRYQADGPLVLREVSFTVRAGQFVAIVGPSGAGKSTILRLLLGFEKPAAGSVFYDGQELSELDVKAVRRQIGVVLQDGSLAPGDILSNIIGSRPLNEDDAWEAARLVGLAEDIKAMPMGMRTMISEGASTISGGQKQRLLIARAIVNRPRLLLFDEATSALDNRSQAVVTKSLEELKVTRLVIAHRLSTIKNADLILVLAGGRVAEQGNFQELMDKRGLFYELASRQMA